MVRLFHCYRSRLNWSFLAILTLSWVITTQISSLSALGSDTFIGWSYGARAQRYDVCPIAGNQALDRLRGGHNGYIVSIIVPDDAHVDDQRSAIPWLFGKLPDNRLLRIQFDPHTLRSEGAPNGSDVHVEAITLTRVDAPWWLWIPGNQQVCQIFRKINY